MDQQKDMMEDCEYIQGTKSYDNKKLVKLLLRED